MDVLIFLETIIDYVESTIGVIESTMGAVGAFLADFFGMITIFINTMHVALSWFIFIFFFLILLIMSIWAMVSYNDFTDNIANIGIYLDTLFDKSLADYFTKYIPSYFNCGTKMIRNLGECITFYILDVIGKIIYAPFALIFWLLGLQDVERLMWSTIYSIDDLVYSISGFHFVHFPDFIQEDCYLCNLEPKPTFYSYPRMKAEPAPSLL